jgi:hypothetical protein
MLLVLLNPPGSRLSRKFRCIVVVAPDLRRIFFHAEIGLMLHSTSIKLTLLSKLIIDDYPNSQIP